MGNKPANVRVTTDQKSGEVKAKITKAKVSDLHIYFPQCDLDCRISINIEADWQGSVDELEQMNPAGDKADRHKDRLSYAQGNYRVDLTQVTQPEPGPSVRLPHSTLTPPPSHRTPLNS